VLAQHVLIGVASLAGATVAIGWAFQLGWRPALLVSLALLTPSTGFILDSLQSLRVSDEERFWIKSKAVAAELVALAVLFVALQSTSVGTLATSVLVLAGMIVLLPGAFRIFAARVLPFAPKSEFAFLLMLAVVCAFVTRRLGVYYLVGAFVVGLTAQRFRERLPAMASDQMVSAVELFASFFVPFYFFSAGLHLRAEDFGFDALATGAAFLVLVIPVRIALVALHRRVALREPWRVGARIGVSMLPTLVFTLVIAERLRDTYVVPRAVFGGLIIYTLLNTLVPGLVLRLPATDLESWPPPSRPPAPPPVVAAPPRSD
jgi:Kef-type K+ transport system membrane component KefB